MPNAVRLENIVKRFPGVVANDQVSLTIERGEIHALLGENGAGKTTLMNILYGMSQPDSGEILIDEKPVKISSPADAIAKGIGMVHQHFLQIPVLSVTENIVLGDKSLREPFLDLKAAKQKILDISKSTGLHVDPDAKVAQLCVGDQQRVEIIKALYRGVKVLIMDEPTSVLTPQETDELFLVLKKLVRQGNTIIFITHKLREVMEISDRVTVLRDGKKIGTVMTKETNRSDLARMMVGREVLLNFNRKPNLKGQKILEVRELYIKGVRGCRGLHGVSLDLHCGEILGIAGVDGNGQKELVEAIMGLNRPEKGDIYIRGTKTNNFSTRQVIDLGVANIPFNRQTEGLVLTFSISEALILKEWRKQPFTKNGLFDRKTIRSFSERLIQEYRIRTTGPDAKVGNMSGGNQQKVILARELYRKPDLLIACLPTHGLDIGATEYVRQQLLNERARGAAILLISTELDEILSLSDRIAVFFDGQVMGFIDASKATVEAIGLMMLGVKQESKEKENTHGS